MSTALRDERRSRLRAAMRDAGLDLLVICGNAWRSDYVRFAADITPMEGEAIALFARDARTRLVIEHPFDAARLALEQPSCDVVCAPDAAAYVAALLRDANPATASRIAIAPAHAVPWSLARAGFAAGADAATALLDALMVAKSAAEADAVARAAALADEGYQVFRAASRVGRREYEVIADVEAWLRARGCPENFIIMGSGQQEVRSMHPPGERRLAPGDLVTTELTPCVDGYYAQLCRTLTIGEPTALQRRAFAVYVEAMEAGIAKVRPGVTHSEIAAAQNDVFRKHGLGEYVSAEYTRVRGHGIGLYVDGPHVLEGVDQVLEPNMTLIVHPNTYHPEAGYIVLGDTVRVTETGCDVLSASARELFAVTA